jgi:hypothetical protein
MLDITKVLEYMNTLIHMGELHATFNKSADLPHQGLIVYKQMIPQLEAATSEEQQRVLLKEIGHWNGGKGSLSDISLRVSKDRHDMTTSHFMDTLNALSNEIRKILATS